MPDAVDEVIRLVRHLDSLEGQRAVIDTEIADLKRDIASRLASQPLQLGPGSQTGGQPESTRRVSPTEKVLEFLSVNGPVGNYQLLARVVYGETDKKALHRMRNLVYSLREKGLVVETEGGWAVP